MTLRTALATATLVLLLPILGLSQTMVEDLVAVNITARGGETAWRNVSSLKMTGWMDIGQETLVPYTLEQKRPGKMRLEFVFNNQTAVQASDNKTGWKLRPFLGRTAPEPMTGKELSEMLDTADLYGLLYDYKARGHAVELLENELVDGKGMFQLKVTLPGGIKTL